ncbi:hypothetical protein GCM10022207_48630 [Streptomyces lannensis]|uniref:Uncharacterized protein n=1 Tax=Streptomyces lannensis TaxID=766498 RepID=A0ABP7KGG7_9ACTN
MVNGDAGGGDRLALAVLAQHRMATTQQVHLMISPTVRIEQTRRRLVKLRTEGLIDRVTLPQAGRTRVWFVTHYGAEVASGWPELRDWRPPRLAADRTAARLRVGHALVVTETALAFVQDARRHGDVCQPLDWIPEVYHSLGGGEALIPDALLYYRRQAKDRGGWSMLRAFVEVDRATMGPSASPQKSAPTSGCTGTSPRLSADPGPAASYRWRNGSVGIPCSRGYCSSLTALDPPASTTASVPSTQAPSSRTSTSCAACPCWPPR